MSTDDDNKRRKTQLEVAASLLSANQPTAGMLPLIRTQAFMESMTQEKIKSICATSRDAYEACKKYGNAFWRRKLETEFNAFLPRNAKNVPNDYFFLKYIRWSRSGLIAAGWNFGVMIHNGKALSFGSIGQAPEPPAGLRYIAVSAGMTHALGLLNNGQIVQWLSRYGIDAEASEDEESDEYKLRWERPPPFWGKRFSAISAGGRHSIALTDKGLVLGWGSNSQGQALYGSNQFDQYGKQKHVIVTISAGNAFSLALTSEGTLVGWGGRHDELLARLEAARPSARTYVDISAGFNYALALLDDGTVIGAGAGFSGDRDKKATGAADALPPGRRYVAISAGRGHSLGLLNDGTVVGWGNDRDKQATGGAEVLPPGRHYVDISAGNGFSLGLLDDGTLVGWGDTQFLNIF